MKVAIVLLSSVGTKLCKIVPLPLSRRSRWRPRQRGLTLRWMPGQFSQAPAKAEVLPFALAATAKASSTRLSGRMHLRMICSFEDLRRLAGARLSFLVSALNARDQAFPHEKEPKVFRLSDLTGYFFELSGDLSTGVKFAEFESRCRLAFESVK